MASKELARLASVSIGSSTRSLATSFCSHHDYARTSRLLMLHGEGLSMPKCVFTPLHGWLI